MSKKTRRGAALNACARLFVAIFIAQEFPSMRAVGLLDDAVASALAETATAGAAAGTADLLLEAAQARASILATIGGAS